MLAAVIAVQQTEGNLLEPLIMKRQVRLHPVVVLLAVTAGTLLGGIVGAFVAVPITAVLYNVFKTVALDRRAAADPGGAADPAAAADPGAPVADPGAPVADPGGADDAGAADDRGATDDGRDSGGTTGR